MSSREGLCQGLFRWHEMHKWRGLSRANVNGKWHGSAWWDNSPPPSLHRFSSFHQLGPCAPDWLILLIYISIISIISTLLAGELWVMGSGRMWLLVSGGEGFQFAEDALELYGNAKSSLGTSAVTLPIIILHKICCRYKMLSASECIQYKGTKMTWFPAAKCWKGPDSCPCWMKRRNLKLSLSHTVIKLICQFCKQAELYQSSLHQGWTLWQPHSVAGLR